ncbi:hypothetical protein [Pseudonocardia sp. N23]|uniref:hypothetical protein n=1 Tax=Pseudonocardia sp. N23 TaxID=1987376 RepID=UPI000BFC8303|nr:hypothetical protein [Pseudonocardia sp. N23]GAY09662.1 PE_PGRS family protein [Pseudonocardia sp. N23]
MSDRLHLASIWDAAPVCVAAGERPCPRCAAVVDDPGAAAVFAALDATRRDLAGLPSRSPGEPGQPSMPDDLRDAVLAAADAIRRGPAAAEPVVHGVPAVEGISSVPDARGLLGAPRASVASGGSGALGALCAADVSGASGTSDASGTSGMADTLGVTGPSTASGASGPGVASGPAPGAPCRSGAARGGSDRGTSGTRGPGRRGQRPGGRSRGRGLLLAAVAAGVVLSGVAVIGVAGQPSPTVPLAVPDQPGTHALVGTPETVHGPLGDPARQAACLGVVGVPTTRALATREVAVDGVPGVLLVLPTGSVGRFRLLVVDPGCGAGGGRVLADRTVDR